MPPSLQPLKCCPKLQELPLQISGKRITDATTRQKNYRCKYPAKELPMQISGKRITIANIRQKNYRCKYPAKELRLQLPGKKLLHKIASLYQVLLP